MKKWILAAALVVLAFPSNGTAQSKDSIVGTWKLVSATNTTDKGEVRDTWGPNPTGLLTYTADGWVMAIITNGGRKPLSVSDPVSAPAEERAEAFATLTAYAGRYTVTGERIIHHVEISWVQNYANTDLVRSIVNLDGNRLTLRTGPYLRGGIQQAYGELVWERLKPETPSR